MKLRVCGGPLPEPSARLARRRRLPKVCHASLPVPARCPTWVQPSQPGGEPKATRLSCTSTNMQNRRSFNGDDLKPFLAVARAGSTLGAAKLLGLSQPTIQRRIAALEKSLGCQLVERYPSGYRLSPLGVELRIRAEQVEKAVDDLHRHIQLYGDKIPGAIRMPCA